MSVAAAVAKAGAGVTIGVAPGTYADSLTLSKPVTIRGRCAAQVTLTTTEAKPLILGDMAKASAATIQGVTLLGGTPAVGLKSGSLTLRDVRIKGAQFFAMLLGTPSAHLVVERSLVEGTLPQPGTKQQGVALDASLGCTVDLRDVRITGARRYGLLVHDAPTQLTAQRVLIDGIDVEQASGLSASGISARDGGTVQVNRVWIANVTGVGILVDGKGASVKGTGVRLTGTTLAPKDSGTGWAIAAQNGGSVSIEGGVIAGNRLGARFGKGGIAVLRGLHIAGADATTGKVVQAFGATIDSADVTLDGVAIDSCGGAGMQVTGAATVDARALVIAQPKALTAAGPLGKAKSGVGIEVQGGEVHLSDTRIYGIDGAGILVVGAGSHVAADHLAVHDVGLDTAGAGLGIALHSGARLDIRGGHIARCQSSAVALSEASALYAVGLRIEATAPEPKQQIGGAAILAMLGSQVVVSGSRFTENHDAAVYGSDASTRITLTGCMVDATRPRPVNSYYGCGVTMTSASRLDLQACRLTDNNVAGVQAQNAEIHVEGSVIAATAAGTAKRVDQSGAKVLSFGDGIVAFGGQLVQVSQTIFAGNGRAGLLLSAVGSAKLDAVLSTAQLFGLVTQGTSGVTEHDLALVANTQQNRASDQGLAIAEPPALGVILP